MANFEFPSGEHSDDFRDLKRGAGELPATPEDFRRPSSTYFETEARAQGALKHTSEVLRDIKLYDVPVISHSHVPVAPVVPGQAARIDTHYSLGQAEGARLVGTMLQEGNLSDHAAQAVGDALIGIVRYIEDTASTGGRVDGERAQAGNLIYRPLHEHPVALARVEPRLTGYATPAPGDNRRPGYDLPQLIGLAKLGVDVSRLVQINPGVGLKVAREVLQAYASLGKSERAVSKDYYRVLQQQARQAFREGNERFFADTARSLSESRAGAFSNASRPLRDLPTVRDQGLYILLGDGAEAAAYSESARSEQLISVIDNVLRTTKAARQDMRGLHLDMGRSIDNEPRVPEIEPPEGGQAVRGPVEPEPRGPSGRTLEQDTKERDARDIGGTALDATMGESEQKDTPPEREQGPGDGALRQQMLVVELALAEGDQGVQVKSDEKGKDPNARQHEARGPEIRGQEIPTPEQQPAERHPFDSERIMNWHLKVKGPRDVEAGRERIEEGKRDREAQAARTQDSVRLQEVREAEAERERVNARQIAQALGPQIRSVEVSAQQVAERAVYWQQREGLTPERAHFRALEELGIAVERSRTDRDDGRDGLGRTYEGRGRK